MKNNRSTLSTVILIVAFAAIYLFGDRLGLSNNSPNPPPPTSTQSSTQSSSTTTRARDDALIMRDVKVYDLDGNLAYEGDIDLAPVLERIERGESDPHDNDGSVFQNREGQLPNKSSGYYHEYVVRTPGISSVGPQRLILGDSGEVYYTPDHYDTFTQVR
jgi:ribonuclease T1